MVESEFSERKLADRLEEEIDGMLASPRQQGVLEIPDLLLGVGVVVMVVSVLSTLIYRLLT